MVETEQPTPSASRASTVGEGNQIAKVQTASVLVLGARSDIGRALAHRFAAAGHPIVLAARNVHDLAQDKADLQIRHQVDVATAEFDVLHTDPSTFLGELEKLPMVAMMVVGLLGDQAASEKDTSSALTVMATNYSGPSSFLLELARQMEKRGSGWIIGISSVAGERGRGSNFIYGSAKAGLTAFLSGLRNRFSRSGVSVITVKPGYVDTRMTSGMKLPPMLTARPEEVAEAAYRAYRTGRDVVYVRPIWRLIMVVIRLVPESVFKRLRL
jgi:decaprenylphospho-beta-D-erythro-pentofuranosid-2-ulose 2-reductase